LDIGIFGGTFNPIHNGHLIVAEQIREWFRLPRIYFVPSALPPHKDGPILEGKHRLKMVELATDSNPYFFASSLEVNRKGHSYTIDTILEMLGEPGEEQTFYFILGADAFLEIKTWKDYTRLLQLCKFIVISRHGVNMDRVMIDLSPFLTGPGLKRILKRIKGDLISRHIDPHKADIFFVSVPQIDISSSDIREMVRRGRSIRYQVPVTVEKYIEENGLYLE
jgi:nicotinate-nucleotide adenylyltransferase